MMPPRTPPTFNMKLGLIRRAKIKSKTLKNSLSSRPLLWCLFVLIGGGYFLATIENSLKAAETETWSQFQPRETAQSLTGTHQPGPNDVSIRTLKFRQVPGTMSNAVDAFRAFHANRLEWVYLGFNEEERKIVTNIKAMGGIFGGSGSGSLTSTFPPVGDVAAQMEMAMLDLDGKPVVQPHMRQWKHPYFIGDVTNPEYYLLHLSSYKRYVDWGAETLQRDEAEAAVFAVEKYGGGFTPTGLKGFAEWLQKNVPMKELLKLGIATPENFDYGNYLKDRNAPVGDAFAQYQDPVKPYWIRYWEEANTDFFSRLVQSVKVYANKPITFSCNNSSLQMWEPYHRVFDFALSELLLESANPRHMWERARKADGIGKFQIFGAPKGRGQKVDAREKVVLERKVVATAYACGMASMLPWDVFEQSSDGESRYFGEPKDFADLSGFIRSQDWRGYSEVAAFGFDISSGETGAASKMIWITGGNGGVYAFVRAASGLNGPSILIHLVDWGRPTVPVATGEERSVLITPSGERIYYPANAEENLKRTLPEPFTLRLKLDDFNNASSLRFVLKLPFPYDEMVHGNAAKTGHFNSLVDSKPVWARQEGDELLLDIPALTPWGVVEIVVTSP